MPENTPIDWGTFWPPEGKIPPIRWMVLGVLVLFLLFTSLFTVDPEEVGVVLTFGEYTRTVEPGLNFKLPFGIETVTKVPVERQQKEEFGFRTDRPDVRTQFSARNFQGESLMLTGDLNAAEVKWVVQYRIKDAKNFLFRVRQPRQTFRNITEAVMREVVGDRTVNEVLTVGRQEIADVVTVKLQELCDQYETGIKVIQVVLQDVTPPDEVKPAFNEVNEAQQEREKVINQARAEYNRVIPQARGQAARIIEEAKGYALERVNRARGEAAKFDAVFKEYLRAKEVTRQRIYLETMNSVLQNVGRKLITDENATGILPLFQFDKEGVK